MLRAVGRARSGRTVARGFPQATVRVPRAAGAVGTGPKGG